MQLLIARHAETVWNVERRIQGWSDSKLSPHGTQQAQALAERLRSVKLDGIYSSDAGRAVLTAECVALWQDVEVVSMEGLRETSWGQWEGMTSEEISAKYPDVWPQFVARGQKPEEETEDWETTTLVPEGENMQDCADRIGKALQEVKAKHKSSSNKVLIVGHGGSLRFLFTQALGVRPALARRFHLDNSSLSEVWFARDHPPVIRRLNDVSHLFDTPAI